MLSSLKNLTCHTLTTLILASPKKDNSGDRTAMQYSLMVSGIVAAASLIADCSKLVDADRKMPTASGEAFAKSLYPNADPNMLKLGQMTCCTIDDCNTLPSGLAIKFEGEGAETRTDSRRKADSLLNALPSLTATQLLD